VSISEDIADAFLKFVNFGLEKNGWPDRVVTLGNGKKIAVEIKKHGDALSVEQKERTRWMAEQGIPVFILSVKSVLPKDEKLTATATISTERALGLRLSTQHGVKPEVDRLLKEGIAPMEIAKVMKCSKQFVYERRRALGLSFDQLGSLE